MSIAEALWVGGGAIFFLGLAISDKEVQCDFWGHPRDQMRYSVHRVGDEVCLKCKRSYFDAG